MGKNKAAVVVNFETGHTIAKTHHCTECHKVVKDTCYKGNIPHMTVCTAIRPDGRRCGNRFPVKGKGCPKHKYVDRHNPEMRRAFERIQKKEKEKEKTALETISEEIEDGIPEEINGGTLEESNKDILGIGAGEAVEVAESEGLDEERPFDTDWHKGERGRGSWMPLAQERKSKKEKRTEKRKEQREKRKRPNTIAEIFHFLKVSFCPPQYRINREISLTIVPGISELGTCVEAHHLFVGEGSPDDRGHSARPPY